MAAARGSEAAQLAVVPTAAPAAWLGVAVGAWLVMGSLRVLADAHWASDTIGGASLGVGAAAFEDLVLLMPLASSRGKLPEEGPPDHTG